MHPELGITKYETTSAVREHPERVVEAGELEGITEYAIDHSFEKSSGDTLRYLARTRLETFLADIRILRFRVDKNDLYEKLRYTGKKVELFISRTFTLRTIFKNTMEAVPPRAHRVIWREGGAMVAHVLTRHKTKLSQGIYAKVGDTRTNIYGIEGGEVRFFDYFPWGKNNLYEAIGGFMGVGKNTAKEITEKIMQGKCSPGVQRKCDTYIIEEIATCLRGIESAARHLFPARKTPHITYLDMMPYAIEKYLGKRIVSLYTSRLVEMYGFTLYNGKDVEKIDTTTIAALLERFLSPKLPAMERAIQNKIEQLRKYR